MIYVLHVHTGKELAVSDELKKIYCRAFTPREMCPERRNGKTEIKERILFPGYVFTDIMLNLGLYYRIKAIPHVIRFLGGGNPQTLTSEEAEYIAWLANLGNPLKVSTMQADGSISEGPLKGLEAKIVSVDKRQRRAKVKISIAGKPHEISLSVISADAEETNEINE